MAVTDLTDIGASSSQTASPTPAAAVVPNWLADAPLGSPHESEVAVALQVLRSADDTVVLEPGEGPLGHPNAIGGLVQVPCIKRNAIGAAEACAAAKLALRRHGRPVGRLDQTIDAMQRAEQDMRNKHKETSRVGLAVSVPPC